MSAAATERFLSDLLATIPLFRMDPDCCQYFDFVKEGIFLMNPSSFLSPELLGGWRHPFSMDFQRLRENPEPSNNVAGKMKVIPSSEWSSA